VVEKETNKGKEKKTRRWGNAWGSQGRGKGIQGGKKNDMGWGDRVGRGHAEVWGFVAKGSGLPSPVAGRQNRRPKKKMKRETCKHLNSTVTRD